MILKLFSYLGKSTEGVGVEARNSGLNLPKLHIYPKETKFILKELFIQRDSQTPQIDTLNFLNFQERTMLK